MATMPSMPRMHARERLQPRRELPREAGRARRRAEDDDEIARADAASAGPAVAGERARVRRRVRPAARRGMFFVELERREVVREIRLRRERRALDAAGRASASSIDWLQT